MDMLNTLIKHKAPMRLIDEFVSADENQAHCRVTVTDENLFFRDSLDGLPAYVGIELMAQTVATAAGFRHQRAGASIKIGFLLGSRKYLCSVPAFERGQTYDIFAEEIHAEASGLSVFGCRIELHGTTIAEARLNVYQPPDEAAFIEEHYD